MPEQTEDQSSEESVMEVEAWTPEEAESYEEKFQEEYTADELQDEVRERNEERGLTQHDPGYMKTSGTKKELARALAEEKMMEETDGPLVETDTHIEEGIKLRQLKLNPKNERFEVDYKDPKLYRSLKMSGEFTNVPQVTPILDSDQNHVENDHGEPMYRIVGGNRSIATLREFVENEIDFETETEFSSPDEYEVDVLVKEYLSDDPAKNEAQELLDITNDNEASLEPSPVARARQYKRQVESGMTQAAVAKKAGKRQSQISKAIALMDLPEPVLELVHYDYNSRRLSELDAEILDEMGVPYHTNADNETIVDGMTLSNAEVMLGMLKDYDDEQVTMDLEDLFISPEVLDKACDYKKDDFERWIYQQAVDHDILDESVMERFSTGTDIAEGDTDSDTSETSQETTGDDSSTDTDEQSASEDESTDDESDDNEPSIRQQIKDQPWNSDHASQDLRSGEVQLAPDAEEKLADILELRREKALDAFKVMKFYDILVDHEDIE